MIQFDIPVWDAIISEAETTAKVDECFIVVQRRSYKKLYGRAIPNEVTLVC
jgi:hypothetical protein